MLKLFKKNYLRQAEYELLKIDDLKSIYSILTDEELKMQTNTLRNELAKGKTKDQILPDAFAVVREACQRVLGKRPYDVQILGGIILHRGQVAEMKTGEGKANPLDLKIPTPNGWKTCGDIQEGDLLFDREGKPTKVIGVYPQGLKMHFDVVLADGRRTPCANSHLWTVYDKCNNDFSEKRVMTAKELFEQDKISPGRFYLDLNEAVQYDNEYKIENTGEIVHSIYDSIKQTNELSSERVKRMSQEKRNEFIENSVKKEYLMSSIDNRWDILDGLMSAYEAKNKDGKSIFKVPTTNKMVLEFIEELIYSLGLAGNVIEEDGNIVATIIFEGHGVISSNFIQITKIEKKQNTRGKMVCFEVDNEEHLFLVGDFVVTHNTIVSAAPIYLNALDGKVHVITVNDYLAERDKNEIGKVLDFLGITTGLIYPKMPKDEKQAAYRSDVIYGTNKEFGFDYLRDNMSKNEKDLFQTGLNFAIIDEVDSVLIDEARTPLIISGQGEGESNLYFVANECVKQLEKGDMPPELTKMESAMNILSEGSDITEEERKKMKDYVVNEKDHMVFLTDAGVEKVEKMLGLSLADEENSEISHHIHQALVAYGTMKKDENYIVKDGQVQIVDDFTGRVLDGRRYSDGLHQAIEAKERVEIQEENKTLATISLQNYFRLYDKIAGMTGTAKTEEQEFKDIYKMSVVEVPTNRPVIRKDEEDLLFVTDKEKLDSVINDIKKHHEKGQPILVGTPTIEQSETVSKMLKKEGIKHNLLNAKNNELEAHIVAQAGIKGAITIATNMAGRGTDIMLGGNPEFLAVEELEKRGYTEDELYVATSFVLPENEDEERLKNEYQEVLKNKKEQCAKNAEEVKRLGGLRVIGTAKHESRRIDNQLRGRAGRQGDPGSSQFFLSLDDDLIRVFASETLRNAAKHLGLEKGEPIKNKQLLAMVPKAQKRLEVKNFDIRKNTLEYDDVNNIQRQIIYKERSGLVKNEISISNKMNEYIVSTSDQIVDKCLKLLKDDAEKDARIVELVNETLKNLAGVQNSIKKDSYSKKELANKVEEVLTGKYIEKINEIKSAGYDPEEIQNQTALRIIDTHWIDYITAMQNLRDLTSLTGYGNNKPVDIYKERSLEMFNDLLNRIKADTVFSILSYYIVKDEYDLGTFEVIL